jgi:DNA-binding GntR family transcriptional regulator
MNESQTAPRRKRQRPARPTTENPGPTSLAEKAYAQLEEMIATLELRPGSVVTEGELASRLRIGRTPLREALQRLAAVRLLTTLPRRGLVITEVNLTDHLGVLETRRVLDRLIAVGAARRATPQQRQSLSEFAALMEQAAGSGNITEFMLLDQDFDELMAGASHNPAASTAIAPLHVHCRRFWYLYKHQGDLQRSARLHEELITAVVQGDEERAARASDELMHYLEDFTRAAFELYLARNHSEQGPPA